MNPPGQRTYACTACGHEQSHSPSDFSAGKAPLCHECHGVLKRVKGPPQSHQDEPTPIKCGSPTFASDAPHTPSTDPTEPCPFD